VARSRTAHPIVSFDKTGQRTLESFECRAGRAEFGGFTLGDGRAECAVNDGGSVQGGTF